MSFLGKLKSVFGAKIEESPEVTLDTYANLPLFQMLQEDPPFSDWLNPESQIPEDLVDTFKIYVWMYQLYVFYILTAQRYGYEIADKVVNLQVERLNKASEELGQQLSIAISQIHNNVVRQAGEPHFVNINGEEIEMPVEYGIAIEFLFIGSDAPFSVNEEELKAGQMPETNGADFALAECLEFGKNSAQSYFEPITKIAKVVL